MVLLRNKSKMNLSKSAAKKKVCLALRQGQKLLFSASVPLKVLPTSRPWAKQKLSRQFLNIPYLCGMLRRVSFIGLLLVSLLGLGQLAAQSAEELRQKRQNLVKELGKTTQQLEKAKSEKSLALNRLQLLQQQIEQRRALITTLHQEVAITDSSLLRNEDVIQSLHLDLDKMRQEYAQILRVADRTKRTQGWLAFVFSARGMNDAFRRLQYLRQYQAYRRRQGQLIVATQSTLSKRTEVLNQIKAEKETLLLAAEEQGSELNKALLSQSGLVQSLTATEQKLHSKVEQQRREEVALEKAISEAIAAEIAAARERERNRNSRSTASSPVAEKPSIGSNFANYKGQLAWPLQGNIVRKFGAQPHPDVPSVTINNGGIDISGGANARVQAVFPGEVLNVRLIPGYRQTLMIRHGNYYTVYSNLDRVLVSVGEEVEAGATIGFSSPSADPIHFELWKGKDRQDPSKWLK